MNVESLQVIAIVHTAGAFLLLAFIITHLYLITTGEKVTSNLKAMLTGFEDVNEEHEQIINDEQLTTQISE